MNETREIQLRERDGGSVKGIVRVRGFDARLGWRGVVVTSHDPVAVIEQRDGAVRRHAIPAVREGLPLAGLIAAPFVARLTARLLSPRRRRSKS